MRVFAKSDIGKVRDNNQDYYYVSEEDSNIKLFILADGMGGYNGGEIASKLATESTRNFIISNLESTGNEREKVLELLKNAIEYANMVVYEEASNNKDLEGMGTTLDVCLIIGNKVFIGHVGDSRVYRIRKEFTRKLTMDHSYVEKLLKEGTITKEEAYNHPKKNMLLKALGCTAYVEPDVMVKGFLKDDIILMCSDGLTNMIKDNEIYEIIKANPEKAAENLVEKANELGGYDNITAVIIL